MAYGRAVLCLKGYDLNLFEEMGLPGPLVKKLALMGITEPTPIQTHAIPFALDGEDVMGLAQTGTGKTAAFGLPLLAKLMEEPGKPAPKAVRSLILAPTRELAGQIRDTLLPLVKDTPIKVALVVGGASIGAQIKRMQMGTDVLVATPGRLLDLLDRRALSLSDTRFLVLDEADQMLDLGFIHALRKIAGLLPSTNTRSVPTTSLTARSPCRFRFRSTGTQRGTAPGIQFGVIPARASSATRMAMRLPP